MTKSKAFIEKLITFAPPYRKENGQNVDFKNVIYL